MKQTEIDRVLEENVEFWPPKTIIEFVIDDGLETTGSIEECANPAGYGLYIDGDEIGWYSTIEDAKTAIAEWIAEE